MVVKLDADGNTQWIKTYGAPNYDNILEIKALSDGYLVCANSQSFSSSSVTDAVILKIDQNGDIIWSK